AWSLRRDSARARSMSARAASDCERESAAFAASTCAPALATDVEVPESWACAAERPPFDVAATICTCASAAAAWAVAAATSASACFSLTEKSAGSSSTRGSPLWTCWLSVTSTFSTAAPTRAETVTTSESTCASSVLSFPRENNETVRYPARPRATTAPRIRYGFARRLTTAVDCSGPAAGGFGSVIARELAIEVIAYRSLFSLALPSALARAGLRNMNLNSLGEQ